MQKSIKKLINGVTNPPKYQDRFNKPTSVHESSNMPTINIPLEYNTSKNKVYIIFSEPSYFTLYKALLVSIGAD